MPTVLPIYFDNNATTPTDPRIAEVIVKFMTREFGNASSVDHIFGERAREAVEKARDEVRSLLGAHQSDRVIFTSGATESINLGLKGLALKYREVGGGRPLRVGLLPVEHPAVLDTIDYLVKQGEAERVFFEVDQKGRVDLDSVWEKCSRGLDVVCVMAAQNEIGNIYPIKVAACIAKEKGALFFTDATQAVGKSELSFDDWNLDLLALSAHKIYGPKGVGALIVKQGLALHPLFHGGRHQDGLRSGTLNVPGIVGFGEASKFRIKEWEQDEKMIASLRDRFQSMLTNNIDGVSVNGDQEHRLSGNLNVSIKGVPNRALVGHLRNKLALSTGAACSSGIEAPSYVLRCLGLSKDILDSAVRFGIGKFNTGAEVESATMLVLGCVQYIRRKLNDVVPVSVLR